MTQPNNTVVVPIDALAFLEQIKKAVNYGGEAPDGPVVVYAHPDSVLARFWGKVTSGMDCQEAWVQSLSEVSDIVNDPLYHPSH